MYFQKDQKLKEQENYLIWKLRILNLAITNSLDRYFSNKYKKPPEINKFDKKTIKRTIKL
jgi:hypothetical protein